jgi:hypothetical protein
VAAIPQDAKQGLLELMVSTGVQVFEAMLEQDRETRCGPRWQRQPERSAVRGGSTRSEVTLGGRRIAIRRPRARGERELALPSFTWAAGRDPLDARTVFGRMQRWRSGSSSGSPTRSIATIRARQPRCAKDSGRRSPCNDSASPARRRDDRALDRRRDLRGAAEVPPHPRPSGP